MKHWFILLLGIFIIAIDQIAKYAIVRVSALHVLNRGFSFGIGQYSSGWIFVVVLFVVWFDAVKHGVRVADVLLLSGGVSNIIDRLIYRGVLDWIHIWTLWFNIADISIMSGVLWIFLSSLRTRTSLS